MSADHSSTGVVDRRQARDPRAGVAVSSERWAAASGYVVFLLGAAAAAFERGAPKANAPAAEVAAFYADYRTELLIQSLLFALSAGVFLWFLGALRSFLLRAEGGPGRLASVAFGAGVLGIGINVLIQAPQSALAKASAGPVEPELAAVIHGVGYAFSVLAYAPFAVMLAAVALVSLRTRAFPAWLAWLAAVTGAMYVLMSAGIAVDGGPLVPGGALSYVLYALYAAWLLSVTTVMVLRLGRPTVVPH